MLNRTLIGLLGVVIVAQISVGLAASPAIGVAMANGSMRLDDARVQGNGTLFEGSRVVTGDAAGLLRFNSGGELELASSSVVQVHRDRVVLEQGAGELVNAANYRIEAMGLEISSDAPGSSARVRIQDDAVEVAALEGGLEVHNRDGVLLAALRPGRALSLMATADGASAPASLTGCAEEREGHYLLTDDTAGITVELRGANLKNQIGQQIAITGVAVPKAEPIDGASQVMQVNNLRTVATRCSSSAAAGAAGGAAAGAAGAAAGGAAATTAVVAGVVVAAAGTGAAIGLTRGDEEKQTISR